MRNDEGVVFEDALIKHVTDKGGALIRFDDGEEVWIPTSQIHDDSDIWKKGESGKLVLTAWICEQKELG